MKMYVLKKTTFVGLMCTVVMIISKNMVSFQPFDVISLNQVPTIRSRFPSEVSSSLTILCDSFLYRH